LKDAQSEGQVMEKGPKLKRYQPYVPPCLILYLSMIARSFGACGWLKDFEQPEVLERFFLTRGGVTPMNKNTPFS